MANRIKMGQIIKFAIILLSLFDWCLNISAQVIFPESINLNNSGSQLSRGFPLLAPLYNHFPGVVGQPVPVPVPVPLPPLPTYPSFQTITPFPTLSTVSTMQTCICVPIGTCATTATDGTGLIDIRIVNNPPSPTPISPCFTGLQRCCFPGPYQCGIRYPPVANSPTPAPGQASYGEYPWQAVLLGTGDIFQGSGVLIDAMNVLTVAHKVANYTSVPNQLRVRMGEWNAAGDTEPLPAQEFLVAKIFIHPNFNPNNLMNDVAILRLTAAVPLGQLPTITTACLPVSSYIGQRCWVSGWGKNDFNGVYQTIQKEVDVPILDASRCQSLLSSTRLGSTYLFDANSFICAGGEPGKDSCTGDGGSPLVCQSGSRFFLAGLSAWGIGCAGSNIPGVYVNVATYMSFIQTSIASS